VVRVPVLSVQITVVEPSVSTAGSLRMMAFFRAMAWVPKARARVTMKGRASGTPATARAIAVMRESINGEPRLASRMKTTMDMAKTRMACLLASCSSLIFRGGGAGLCRIIPEIFPSSVARPVAVTMALQLP